MKKKILIADNDPDFLNTRAEFLENAGYHVLKAYSLEQARQLLGNTYFHLAILDIRLVNDDDEKDISGLTLAKKSAYRSVPKIMLTGFPSVQAVREAMGPALDGLPPAVNFIAKSEGPNAMIDAVDEALNQFVQINWDLSIQWDPREHLSFLYLSSLVQGSLPDDVLMRHAEELEDLIRKLFHDYQQIRIESLLWSANKRFCLPVLAQSSQGTTDSLLLVCGDRECLEQDRKNINELAPKTLQGSKLSHTTETIHFSANTLELTNTSVETVQTLRALFHLGKEKPLKAAFDHLLGDVLKAWHQHGHIVDKTGDLMFLYRQCVGLVDDETARKELDRRADSLMQSSRTLEGVDISRDNQQMIFHLPQQSPLCYPDPVRTVYTPLIQSKAPVICRISPGKLTPDNVLVDVNQKTWLTDFIYAGQMPQWWDFICLEAAIRFDLCHAPDILAWQDFEKCLVECTALNEGLKQNDVIPEMRTSITLIEQIRQQAASETGNNILPYYAGLLAWIVEAISHYDPSSLSTQADRLRGTHLLLAASMIAGRLSEAPFSPPQGETLKLDDEGTVWLGNRRIITLMGLELDLLRYLYKHAQSSRLVSRKEIMENVYTEKYDASDKDQEQKINALISRLRKKVEPYQDHPRYIMTSHGGGYRLFVDGEPKK